MNGVKPKCALCGKPIRDGQTVSHFKVEGECVGFGCRFDEEHHFHDECLTAAEGIDEKARAQVLDYLEAFQKSQGTLRELKDQNLERAKKLLKEMEWRRKYK